MTDRDEAPWKAAAAQGSAAAVRAYSAVGSAQAAIDHVGEQRWRSPLHELYQPYVTPSGIVRIVNTIGWVIPGR